MFDSATAWVQRHPSHTRPDYAKWDKFTDFRLDNTACLWIDREPSQHLDEEEAAIFRMLERHVSDGSLPVKRNDKRDLIAGSVRKPAGHVVKAKPDWIVERNELLMLAMTLNEKPPFLYKTERIK